MSDLLGQNEVDALLAAVQSGNVKLAQGQSPQPAGTVEPYDFTRPERINKDQLRALTALHESFARSFSAGLSGLMRTPVEVTLSSIEQLGYSEFIAGLANPTALAVISASSLPGSFVLEISPAIVYPIIDRMLGGNQLQVVIPERPLTDIEQRLARRLVTNSLPLLEETWSNIHKIALTVSEMATNPQLVQVVPPHETIVLVRFEITLGANSGAMNLCMPHSSIEPLMGRLSGRGWLAPSHPTTDDSHAVLVAKALSTAELEMVAYLASTTITVRELLELQVGDVIKTNLPVDGEITLSVEGKTKFKGHPGRARRNKAVQVTRRLPPEAQD